MTEPNYAYHRVAAANVTVVNRPGSHAHVISLANLPGVVAANIFLSLFNPADSGTLVVGNSLTISNFATGVNNATDCMRIRRITGHSGGVLATSSVLAMDPNAPASVITARTGNPTTSSPSANLAVVSPPILIGATVSVVSFYQYDAQAGYFQVPPGFGIDFITSAGSTAQQWNIAASWAEILL